MPNLFLSNVVCDCQESELRSWIEACGFSVDTIDFVRDTVAGVSPCFAYVKLSNDQQHTEAIRVLNGRDFKGRLVQVRADWRKAKGSIAL